MDSRYDERSKYVGLDITGLSSHRRGQRILNAMMASNAEQFKTKRGRMAIILKIETFEKLREQLELVTQDADDGLLSVVLPAEPVTPTATPIANAT